MIARQRTGKPAQDSDRSGLEDSAGEIQFAVVAAFARKQMTKVLSNSAAYSLMNSRGNQGVGVGVRKRR